MTARRARLPLRALVVIVLGVIVLGLALVGYQVRSSASGGSDVPNLQESVVFYYQRIDPARDKPKFRGASVVVTTPQPDERNAIATIHAAGARAFMYVNEFWFPTDRVYEGIDLGHHLDWAFCARGDAPLVGRRIAGSTWPYLDLNERGARDAVMAYLRGLKQIGFDGIFVDRGSPSLRGTPLSPIGWERSSCTAHPVSPGRPRFADVFVDFLREVKQHLGLTIFINYGHPFSGRRLRPDPDDRNCRAYRASCRYRSDIWHYVDRVIDEYANAPTLAGFGADYNENLASERGRERRGSPSRVIRAVKVSATDGRLVFYLWARARLFRLATFINTGDDGCPNVPPALRSKCQRWGTHPELTRLRLGEPLQSLPQRESCAPGSALACVWFRRYQLGAVVVNTRSTSERLSHLSLGLPGCRSVTAVSALGRVRLGGGRCVSQLDYRLPPESGTIFIYTD